MWTIEAENEPMPQVGDVEVVVDHRNEPAFITRITEVQVVPYNAVSAEYAAIEREGDGSLDYWREAHWAFFSRECKRIGREPAERLRVFRSCPLITPERARSSLQMRAIARAMAVLCV